MRAHRNEKKILEERFLEYSSFHQTTGNKITHYFGIPMIVISILAILSRLHFGFFLDGGIVLIGLSFVYYFYLDTIIAFPFLFIIVGMYFLSQNLPFQFSIALFILGWILQALGHAVYEKKSPAFFTNLTHLLIGPLWIFSRCVGYKHPRTIGKAWKSKKVKRTA